MGAASPTESPTILISIGASTGSNDEGSEFPWWILIVIVLLVVGIVGAVLWRKKIAGAGDLDKARISAAFTNPLYDASNTDAQNMSNPIYSDATDVGVPPTGQGYLDVTPNSPGGVGYHDVTPNGPGGGVTVQNGAFIGMAGAANAYDEEDLGGFDESNVDDAGFGVYDEVDVDMLDQEGIYDESAVMDEVEFE